VDGFCAQTRQLRNNIAHKQSSFPSDTNELSLSEIMI
jgi:hypothetical protein